MTLIFKEAHYKSECPPDVPNPLTQYMDEVKEFLLTDFKKACEKNWSNVTCQFCGINVWEVYPTLLQGTDYSSFGSYNPWCAQIECTGCGNIQRFNAQKFGWDRFLQRYLG